jgi:U3 small nucleolar RNA-associated protein 15
VAPHDFAVSSSTRVRRFTVQGSFSFVLLLNIIPDQVQIFNPSTNEPKKTITRFKDVVYGARFRGDGKLLVAGGEEGIVRVFDTSSRAIFRSFEGHKKYVFYYISAVLGGKIRLEGLHLEFTAGL